MSDKENDAPSFYPTGVDNTSQLLEDEDLFTREQWQLFHRGPFLGSDGKIALRAFSHKEVILIAFLLEETDDSFLVVLPAHLSRDEEGVKATQIIASPVARLLKTSVASVSMPTPVQILYYLSLTRQQYATCGYFTKARIEHIDNLIDILKIELGVKKSPKSETLVKVAASDTKTDKEDTFSIPDHMIPRIQH